MKKAYDRRKKAKFTNQSEQKKSSYSPLRCNEVVREVGQDAIKSPMADAYLYRPVEITGEAPIAARICGSRMMVEGITSARHSTFDHCDPCTPRKISTAHHDACGTHSYQASGFRPRLINSLSLHRPKTMMPLAFAVKRVP